MWKAQPRIWMIWHKEADRLSYQTAKITNLSSAVGEKLIAD